VLLWKYNRTQVLFAGSLMIHRNDRYERDGETEALIIKNIAQEMAGDYRFVF
jgi:hypothetical protein